MTTQTHRPRKPVSLGSKWPPARCKRLRSLVDLGYSNAQIAKKLGATTSAIIAKRYMLGIHRSGVSLGGDPSNGSKEPARSPWAGRHWYERAWAAHSISERLDLASVPIGH